MFRFVDRRALRGEQQFLRVLRDRQNPHQFFRVNINNVIADEGGEETPNLVEN